MRRSRPTNLAFLSPSIAEPVGKGGPQIDGGAARGATFSPFRAEVRWKFSLTMYCYSHAKILFIWLVNTKARIDDLGKICHCGIMTMNFPLAVPAAAKITAANRNC